MSSEVPAQGDSEPVSAEEWRPWPRDPLRYRVSSYGRVMGPSGKILDQRPGSMPRRYLIVTVTQFDRPRPDGRPGRPVAHPVHRMVCETFHGPRPADKEAAHEDGRHHNNRADNMSWKLPEDNWADIVRHGNRRDHGRGRNRGRHHPRAVLTEDTVREIRARFAGGGCSYSSLAREYGTHVNTVRQAVLRETWKHVA